MTHLSINQSMIDFSKSFADFKNFEANSVHQMETKIKLLYQSLVERKNSRDTSHPHHLPLALQLTEILTSEQLQDQDHLKALMSKTALIAWELVIFKFVTEERHIYEETYNKASDAIQMSLSTLPREEFETRFYLRCLGALLTIPERGIGTNKLAFRRIAKQFAVAALQIGASGKSAPAACAALVPPIVEVITFVAEKLTVRWYKKIWKIEWKFSGNIIDTPDKLQELAKKVTSYKQCNKKNFYIANLYFDIIGNEKVPFDIRQDLFNGATVTPNFLHLTTLSGHIKNKKDLTCDKHWKTRLIAVNHLIDLAQKSDFQDKSIEQMFSLFSQEKNGFIAKHLSKGISILHQDTSKKDSISTLMKTIPIHRLIKDAEAQLDKITVMAKRENTLLTQQVQSIILILLGNIQEWKQALDEKIERINRGENQSFMNQTAHTHPSDTDLEQDPELKLKQQNQLLDSMQKLKAALPTLEEALPTLEEALPTLDVNYLTDLVNPQLKNMFNDYVETTPSQKNILEPYLQKLESIKHILLQLEAYKSLPIESVS
ncbi:MAG: hypothetical protein QRY72_02955 [Candidatus Rhabdochlamydia sp.]